MRYDERGEDMMLDTDRALIQAAAAVARLRCRSTWHTLATAARTPQGRVFSGVNLHHHTGDTCPEVLVVGTVAAQAGGELETIVTVGDLGREIIAPCQRCCQLLLDYFPRIRVIVGPVEDPRVSPLAELSLATG